MKDKKQHLFMEQLDLSRKKEHKVIMKNGTSHRRIEKHQCFFPSNVLPLSGYLEYELPRNEYEVSMIYFLKKYYIRARFRKTQFESSDPHMFIYLFLFHICVVMYIQSYDLRVEQSSWEGFRNVGISQNVVRNLIM